MPGFDPRLMALRGRIGAHVAHSRHDSRLLTEKARQAFRERFEHEVDPDRTLTLDERRRRADQARRAHYARLALRSAEKRRAAAAARKGASQKPHSSVPSSAASATEVSVRSYARAKRA